MAQGHRKQKSKHQKENVISRKLEQRFWMYVWTIKLIVLLAIFIILFIFVRKLVLR